MDLAVKCIGKSAGTSVSLQHAKRASKGGEEGRETGVSGGLKGPRRRTGIR